MVSIDRLEGPQPRRTCCMAHDEDTRAKFVVTDHGVQMYVCGLHVHDVRRTLASKYTPTDPPKLVLLKGGKT